MRRGSLFLATIALAILTGTLVMVAWIQLGALKTRSIAEFLLHVEKRYGDKAIIDARTYISELLFEAGYFEEESEKLRSKKLKKVAKQIFDKRNKSKERKNTILLHNLLDFLETVSYFEKEKYIDINDIIEIFGELFVQYHTLFHKWLEEFNGDKESYPHFPKLAKRVKKEMEKRHIQKILQ